MSYFVTRRATWRPDQPQPVYKAVADAAIARWTPAFQSELAGVRSRDRATFDLSSMDSDPQSGWFTVTLPAAATPAQRWPAIHQNSGTLFRSDARPALDVRGYHWAPQFVSPVPLVDALAAKWSPAFVAQRSSERSRDRAVLDLTTMDSDPQSGWITATFTPPATLAQRWPAVLQNTGTFYRSDARPSLDVRAYDWSPEFISPTRVVDAIVASWAPAVNAQRASERSRDRASLDLATLDSDPQPGGWFTVTFTVAPSTAQTWPAVLAGLPLSYRSGERQRLDVRGSEWNPETGWVPRVVDGVVASWSSIFSAEASSTRSAERSALDVRRGFWAPDASPWIVSVVSPTVTVAQFWPALQQALSGFRASGAAPFDVRRSEWLQPSWSRAVVDATVARWAPVWSAEVGYRSADKLTLDVRAGTRDPHIGWWAGVLVFVAPNGVLIQMRGASSSLVAFDGASSATIQLRGEV